LIISVLIPTGANQYQSGAVDNVHGTTRPDGNTRQHSKGYIVTLAKHGGDRKSKRIKGGILPLDTSQHGTSRQLGRVVLLIISTALPVLLEHHASTLWNLAFVSEKVKSLRRRKDLSSPTCTRARLQRKQKRPALKPASSTLCCALQTSRRREDLTFPLTSSRFPSGG
jgi:hypothetical protein